jgi:hypothetical protein
MTQKYVFLFKKTKYHGSGNQAGYVIIHPEGFSDMSERFPDTFGRFPDTFENSRNSGKKLFSICAFLDIFAYLSTPF